MNSRTNPFPQEPLMVLAWKSIESDPSTCAKWHKFCQNRLRRLSGDYKYDPLVREDLLQKGVKILENKRLKSRRFVVGKLIDAYIYFGRWPYSDKMGAYLGRRLSL